MDVSDTDVTGNFLTSDHSFQVSHSKHRGDVFFHVPLVAGVAGLFQREVVETITNHALRVIRDHVAHANKVEADASEVVLVRNCQHFWERIQGHEEVFSCLLFGARAVRNTVLDTGDHALVELLCCCELQRIQFIVDVRCVQEPVLSRVFKLGSSGIELVVQC